MPVPDEPEILGAGDEAATDAVSPPPPNPDPKPRTAKRAPARRKPARRTRAKAATAKPGSTPPALSEAPKLTPTATRNRRANAASELLCIPAIPATIVASSGNQTAAVLADHFKSVGPITGRKLAELADESPEIARVLDKAATGNMMYALIMVGLGYMGPVLLALAGRPEQAMGASTAVVLMDAAPGSLAAMMEAVANTDPYLGDDRDDDQSAVPAEQPPAAPAPPTS